MFQLLHNSIAMGRRHHLKGVYSFKIGGKKRSHHDKEPPIDGREEVVCTFKEGAYVENEIDKGAAADPIMVSYMGSHGTLRPWDPNSCVIAAGVCNHFINFPIRPGSWVFVVDCSLKSLSHISDIVGSQGGVIGVMDETFPEKPTPAQRARFYKDYPNTTIISADVRHASKEYYEQALSVPEACKHAVLLALHPKVDASTCHLRRLGEAKEPRLLLARIFSFLECGHVALVKTLVFCHWPPKTRADTIRDAVLQHLQIIRTWRAPPRPEPHAPVEASAGSGEGENSSPRSEKGTSRREKTVTIQEDAAKPERRNSKSRSDKQATPQWVLLGLPMDHIVTDGQSSNNPLVEVIEVMKKQGSSSRHTGLHAKEQLPLSPYFANHALLLLKHCGRTQSHTQDKPHVATVPMPAFRKAMGKAAPQPEPPLQEARAPKAPEPGALPQHFAAQARKQPPDPGTATTRALPEPAPPLWAAQPPPQRGWQNSTALGHAPCSGRPAKAEAPLPSRQVPMRRDLEPSLWQQEPGPPEPDLLPLRWQAQAAQVAQVAQAAQTVQAAQVAQAAQSVRGGWERQLETGDVPPELEVPNWQQPDPQLLGSRPHPHVDTELWSWTAPQAPPSVPEPEPRNWPRQQWDLAEQLYGSVPPELEVPPRSWLHHPGAVPSAVPSAVPGAVPSAVPGAVPAGASVPKQHAPQAPRLRVPPAPPALPPALLQGRGLGPRRMGPATWPEQQQRMFQ